MIKKKIRNWNHLRKNEDYIENLYKIYFIGLPLSIINTVIVCSVEEKITARKNKRC